MNPFPPLTREVATDLLDFNPETGELWWKERTERGFRFAGRPALTYIDNRGYRVGSLNYRREQAHRVIFLLANGFLPEAVDHINGDKLDNRAANLRPATKQINARNMKRPANNSSGCVGVSYSKRRGLWRAYITIDDQQLFLGEHKDFGSAVSARKAAEFAHNFHPNHGR